MRVCRERRASARSEGLLEDVSYAVRVCRGRRASACSEDLLEDVSYAVRVCRARCELVRGSHNFGFRTCPVLAGVESEGLHGILCSAVGQSQSSAYI